jgi:transcriptional regulator of acetoin/glycerol metabolism
MRALQQHDWPGNVRELRHVLERSAALSPSTALGRDDIMRALAHGQRPKQNEVDLAERDRLVDIMELHDWDTAAAAARFGVHRGTIYRWLQRFGISRPQRRILLTSASESKVRSL